MIAKADRWYGKVGAEVWLQGEKFTRLQPRFDQASERVYRSFDLERAWQGSQVEKDISAQPEQSEETQGEIRAQKSDPTDQIRVAIHKQ